MEKVQALLDAVERMPRGGDLEGLIESHLKGLNRQCYEICLARRNAAASEASEDFSPSGLPALSEADAPRAAQGAADPDAPR